MGSKTSRVGDQSVAKIISALLDAGYDVLLPFGDNKPYDIVAEKEGTFTKIQCKTGRIEKDSIRFNLYSVGRDSKENKYFRKTYENKIDAFGIYSDHTKECYLVPASVLGKAEGNLRLTPTKYSHKSYLEAKDFKISREDA